MGAELSNLRSFRTRAKEEAQTRQLQTALQMERETKTHKYLSKRRRMHVQTIVVRNSSDYHSGNQPHVYSMHACMHSDVVIYATDFTTTSLFISQSNKTSLYFTLSLS